MPAFAGTVGPVTVISTLAPPLIEQGTAAVHTGESEYGLEAPRPSVVHHDAVPVPAAVTWMVCVVGLVPQATKPVLPPALPKARELGDADSVGDGGAASG
jgi:hypothetical protein